MTTASDETVILESNDEMFTLTTRKVRFDSLRHGSGAVVSILLEHVTSCELGKRSRPLFLVLAVMLLIIGIAIAGGVGSGVPAAVGFVLAVLLAIVYFATRVQFLVIASPSASIVLDVQSIGTDKIIEVIGEIEQAADRRRQELIPSSSGA